MFLTQNPAFELQGKIERINYVSNALTSIFPELWIRTEFFGITDYVTFVSQIKSNG